MASHEHILEDLHTLFEPISIGFPNGRRMFGQKARVVNLRDGLKLKKVFYTLIFN